MPQEALSSTTSVRYAPLPTLRSTALTRILAGKDPLDVAHPIQKIIVSHGWIVRPLPL